MNFTKFPYLVAEEHAAEAVLFGWVHPWVAGKGNDSLVRHGDWGRLKQKLTRHAQFEPVQYEAAVSIVHNESARSAKGFGYIEVQVEFEDGGYE